MVDGRYLETYFSNNSMIVMKFSTVSHTDPLNHTGWNEMLFAGQTWGHPKNY